MPKRMAAQRRRKRRSEKGRDCSLKRRGVVALSAFVGTVLALAGCRHHGGASPQGVATLSPPSPAPTWTPSQRADLQGTMAAIFSDDVTEHSAGLDVVSGDGKQLFERRAYVAFTPASTLKLLVAATALDVLGAKHRFVTKFVAAAPPDPTGSLRGNLWLVGGGDPSLTSDQLRDGVAMLWRAGVRRIDGSLEVDASAFNGPEQNPHWDPSDLTYDYAAGTSAISLDEDTVEFDVTPDPAGGAATIRTVPANDSIVFDGRIASGGPSSVSIVAQPDPPAPAVDSDRGPEPRSVFVVDGTVPEGAAQQFVEPVVGIPGYVAGAVFAMLTQRHIAVAGGFSDGIAPPYAPPLWLHRSPPLVDLVHNMLVVSDNHYAEQMLKTLGESAGHPGTDLGGVAVEKHELSRLGVPRDRMAVYDASGLAPSDKIMPDSLAQLLVAEARSPAGDAYVRSLPRVGIEGTVQDHVLHAALGRIRAKSGHIADVNDLAGYVQTRHHGRIAFVFEVNSPDANSETVYDEEDHALDVLSRY